jgi:hypothetical protein
MEQLVEIKKEQEVANCTFKPTINAGGSTGGADVGADKVFYERLYKDSVRNNNKKLKTEIYANSNEDKRYTF